MVCNKCGEQPAFPVMLCEACESRIRRCAELEQAVREPTEQERAHMKAAIELVMDRAYQEDLEPNDPESWYAVAETLRARQGENE